MRTPQAQLIRQLVTGFWATQVILARALRQHCRVRFGCDSAEYMAAAQFALEVERAHRASEDKEEYA
jgi:hypothetical protein